MQRMGTTYSKKYNFDLIDRNWGEVQLEDIEKVLVSVADVIYANIDLKRLPDKSITIRNTEQGYPQIIKSYDDNNIILLYVQDTFWNKYSYQFAHELCHHVIDKTFCENDRFAWFEEAICELASIFTLRQMSKIWMNNPPYQNWSDYSYALNDYATSSMKVESTELYSLEWLNKNLEYLYIERYDRDKNRSISNMLLPLFEDKPIIWSSIQYLKEIEVTDNMTFKEYIISWGSKIPEGLRPIFKLLKSKLVGI